MKKLLFGILTFLGIGFSFCSANLISDSSVVVFNPGNHSTVGFLSGYDVYCLKPISFNCYFEFNAGTSPEQNGYLFYFGDSNDNYYGICSNVETIGFYVRNSCPIQITRFIFNQSSSINVLYNNENSSTSIACNGDNVIQIDGLSTITATNKFTPYFNIDYRDEDNQSLIESYSKDILYLSGGLYKKTYTGDNDWILNVLNVKQESDFTGYVPTFDVVFTGDSWEDTGNVFNNFAQNSLQVALSNIPSYIQYVIIIMLLFFILGLARRKKRR